MKVADVLRARVNQVLVEQKKTPADLARAMKRKSSWFSNFMNGRNATPLATVDLIAEALHVDGCSLFDPSRLGQTTQPVEVPNLAAHAEEEGAPAMTDYRRESLKTLVNAVADDKLDSAFRAILDVMAAAPHGDRRAIPNEGAEHGTG